jgi:hypothetical protein
MEGMTQCRGGTRNTYDIKEFRTLLFRSFRKNGGRVISQDCRINVAAEYVGWMIHLILNGA